MKKAPMHWKRWLTALVLIPLLIFLVFKGGPVLFAIFLILISTICLFEYFRIVYQDHNPVVPGYYLLWAYFTGAVLISTAAYGSLTGFITIFAITVLGTAFFSLLRFKVNQDAPIVAIKQVFGVVYIPFLLSFAILIHGGRNGPLWIFFVIWVVAWGDTGALYTGTYFGRHKLYPAVSPKKTIEGAIGGLISNAGFGLLFKYLFFNQLSVPVCVFFALTVGIAGQLGDLFESEFKRASGIKDSGRILPGHGGFLDRIDALLFAAPVAYLLKEFII
ncbi:MAG: phosphatidate cytidylyltransferase [Desulfobacteraceae bacterium]|nr:phosphatidate cytidylyltransferase [Desulfobacteraceae bacterium]